MGIVNVRASIGRSREELQDTEFLVDTGSLYTFLPPDTLSELGITPTVTTTVILANSETQEVGLAIAYMRLMGREGGIPVGSMDVPMPLLGATALEILGLKGNPVGETLEHSRPFGPMALGMGVAQPAHVLRRAQGERALFLRSW